MFESKHIENQISAVDCSSVNGDGDETRKRIATAEIRRDDDDDDDDDDGKMEIGKKGFGKAKQVMFYPFRKAKKQILRCRIKRTSSCSSSCSSSIFSITRTNSWDKSVYDASVNQGCGFCFAKHSISDSKNGSPTDPNHPKFTNEMLKVLIEKNDFYSKESNPHLDFQVDTKQEEDIQLGFAC